MDDIEANKAELQEQLILQNTAKMNVDRAAAQKNESENVNATHSKITLQPIAEGQDVLIVIGERLNKEAVESYIQSDSFRM